uniref:CSON015150 protein n=1 Tax=Culicoides sonorensis TaxID=179676 RepID=A0A336MIB5_CULSO
MPPKDKKVWTFGCKEQLFLEKILREKQVLPTDMPSTVQAKFNEFKDFSPAVFRKNWALTKKRFENNLSSYRDPETYDESSNLSMPEIDGTESSSQQPPSKKFKLDDHSTEVEFVQPPALVNVYTDPDSKQKKCGVSVLLFAGIKEINFDIVKENNHQVFKINYSWPTMMFDTEKMFTSNGEMLWPKLHPMVTGMETALMGVRRNIDEAPQGSISVTLPVEVNTNPESWIKKSNKSKDGAMVFFIIFECLENEYAVSSKSKTFKFD